VDPDVVDFHSFTRGIGLPHVRAAAERGTRVVLTLHVASVVCPRGTMLRFGRIACDGDLARRPCAACRLHGRGLPRPIAAVVAGLGAAGRAGAWAVLGRVGGRAQPPAAMAAHRWRFDEAMRRADRVVAPSRWLVEALRTNGVPREKLVYCPQGVEPAATDARSPSEAGLRVGYLGRFDPGKGIHVLVEAVRRAPPELPLACHIWASGTSTVAGAYRDRLARLARGDRRIRFHGPVPTPGEAFAAMDLLAVPSLALETGPLVVLEAFAAGVPVIGSDLGGIAERIRAGVDGLLFPPGDVGALAGMLETLARDRTRLERLRAGIGPVRTMDQVAAETRATYAGLIPAPLGPVAAAGGHR